MNQDIKSHKRHLAEQLLRDTEQSSLLRLHTWLLVAKRLARIIGHTRIESWLNAELQGYNDPGSDAVQIEYAERSGRLLEPSTGAGDWRPIAEIVADGGCGYRQNITARLQALVHEFATDTYYTLEFGDQAESTFQLQRTAIDMTLADFMGDTLARIPVLYDRLARNDQAAVGPVLKTCQQMVNTFSIVATHRGSNPLSRSHVKAHKIDDQLDLINEFIKRWCKDNHRIDRLIADVARQTKYLASCHPQTTRPKEAKFLVMKTYMLLAEIFSLKTEAAAAA